MSINESNKKVLRVGFPSTLPSSAYEPTNISLDYEYIFLENVFSPLVETDAKGVIQPGVAEKADWVGDELRFMIREGFKTKSGYQISAADVVFSLKRLLVLTGNTHGNFKDIVCPGVSLKSIDDDCPGIRQEGRYVFIHANGKKSFLLPMLAAIDFAIIPRKSADPNTLKITDFSETSGPYYVSHDDGRGQIELKLNPYHYHASEEIAEVVRFVPTNTQVQGDSLRALEQNKVDHLTTVDAAKADDLLDFARKNPNFSSHATMKIRSLVLVFTERGQRELSPEERRFIGEKMRSAFLKIYQSIPGFEQRSEFFPSLGEGGLSEEQLHRLSKLQEQQLKTFGKVFRIGLIKRGSIEAWSGPIKKLLPSADCYVETNVPDFKKYENPEQVPHAWVASTDTGFMEDIGLISYSLNAGLLGKKKSERAGWLTKYMAIDDKATRLKLLRELHFEALAEPAIVPLMASPYAALTRKPWRMALSDLYANNQLWLIKTN